MTNVQDDPFLLLAATLLESLPASGTALDAVVLQLQSMFGSMLLSALQLVDRREVVLIELSNKRQLYQVTSSTGKPYTLYMRLSDRVKESDRGADSTHRGKDQMVADADKPDTAPLHNQENNMLSPSDTRAIPQDYKAKQAQTVQWLAREMDRAYCPCTGFMYNSLAGEKNILCKHLLAVLIAHYSQRLVKAEVQFPAVVSLLDLGA